MSLPIVAPPDVQPIDWNGLHRQYLNAGEMEIIAALLRGVDARRMAEFGCRDGRTARVLLANVPTLASYVGVDVPRSYQPALSHQLDEMVASPGHLVADDPRFRLVVRPRGSLDVAPDDLGRIDAAFVDGDHSEAVVDWDSRLARAVVRPGGVIIWHDYANVAVEVMRALDRLRGDGWPIVSIDGTWLACMVAPGAA